MFWDNFVNVCFINDTSPHNVAEKIGVTNDDISAWMNGDMPSVKELIQISRHFGCSVDYLLGISETVYSIKEKELIAAYRDKPEIQNLLNMVLGPLDNKE